MVEGKLFPTRSKYLLRKSGGGRMTLGSMVKTETQRGFQVLSEAGSPSSRVQATTSGITLTFSDHLRLVHWRGADTHIYTRVYTVQSCSRERRAGSWKPTQKDLILKQKWIKQVNSLRATSGQRSKISMGEHTRRHGTGLQTPLLLTAREPPPTSLELALSPSGHPDGEDTGWGWGSNMLHKSP